MTDPAVISHQKAATDLAFELAAVLSETLLSMQAVGQAAVAGDTPVLMTAARNFQQVHAEAREALMRFHAWVEATP